MRSIGHANAVHNISPMLDSLAVWPFTQRLGYTKDQVDAITRGARREMEDHSLRLYIPL